MAKTVLAIRIDPALRERLAGLAAIRDMTITDLIGDKVAAAIASVIDVEVITESATTIGN